ncbi:MAG: DUF169 domain-containing protein [Desulfurococcales archaeon]|nr:DUF169 domain-containing protein [Desulfurococcales archaeon]
MSYVDNSRKLWSILRLRTLPVGIKFLDKDPDNTPLPGFRPLRDFRRRMTFCQAAAIARYYGWPMLLGLEDLSCPGAMVVLGLAEPPEYFLDGSISAGLYAPDKETGARLDRHVIPKDMPRYKGVSIFPSTEKIAEPDVILVYLTPGQLSKLATAIAYASGEPLKIESAGKAGSCGGVVKAHSTRKPVGILPGLGDRTIAWTMDDEMAAAIPIKLFSQIVESLEEQQNQGVITYPPKPFLFYEFKFKNIPIIGTYYDRFLKEVQKQNNDQK